MFADPDCKPASRGRHAPPAWGPRVVALALWATIVLALHGIVLAGWPLSKAGVDAAPVPRALRVRQLAAAAPARTMVPPTPRAAARPLPAPRPRVQPPAPLPDATPAPAPERSAAAGPAPAQAVAPAHVDAEPEAPLQLAAAVERVPLAAGDPPPTYRTRLPPAAALRYELRRGSLSGQGVLRWQPGADGYELTMEGSVLGFQFLAQQSTGGFDAAGLAPQRFVDRRRGRAQQAANFQRERGLITYSGASEQHPLVAGAQDRVSWMVQLAAIVDADPSRWRSGEHIEMAVSGARGDADVWTFTVAGREAVTLVGGARVESALLLRREPRKPFDTRVEVWLDPTRHHLPVRLQLTGARADEALVFVLEP